VGWAVEAVKLAKIHLTPHVNEDFHIMEIEVVAVVLLEVIHR
jgi:hypothetical protein